MRDKDFDEMKLTFKKNGANYSDRAAIRRLALAGAKPEEVSDELRIDLDVVKSFWPKEEKKKGK